MRDHLFLKTFQGDESYGDNDYRKNNGDEQLDQSDIKLNKIKEGEEVEEDESPYSMFQKRIDNTNLLPDQLAQMRAVIEGNFEGELKDEFFVSGGESLLSKVSV